jgi:hypothetical protein
MKEAKSRIIKNKVIKAKIVLKVKQKGQKPKSFTKKKKQDG